MEPLFCIDFSPEQATRLLEIARDSIRHGLVARWPPRVAPADCIGALGERLGGFVTLTKKSVLRGCVGVIEGDKPLAEVVSTAAFNAAYHDSRYPGLTADEFDQILIEISVLSPPQVINVANEAELLATLKPAEDGLILADGECRATFLPKVWEKIPEPARFVRALKYKAGLTEDYWSESICFYRYRTTSVAERQASTLAPA